jgi:hypothetical protein
MAEIDIRSYSLVDDAAPTLIFSGRGIVNFTQVGSGSVMLSNQAGTQKWAVPPEMTFYQDTDVYAAYSESGSNPPQVISILVRPLPATAQLVVDCGA